MTAQNLWESVKAMLKGRFIAIQVYLKKQEKNQINNLTLHLVSKSHSVVFDFLQPHRLHSPWNSPGQNTGVGSLSLLQGIFPTQGLIAGLPLCRWIHYQLSYLKQLEKEETKNPGVSRRKEIIKIRAEINEKGNQSKNQQT